MASQLRLHHRWVPVYPLALAAYPALFLYSTNLREMIDPGHLVLPLAISVGGAAILFALLRLALRSLGSAALLTGWLVVAFFAYGHAWVLLGPNLPDQAALLVPWLAATILIPIIWWSFGIRISGLAGGLNALSVGLVAFTLGQIAFFHVQLGTAEAPRDSAGESAARDTTDPGNRPDIYWIVLDRYGSNGTMRRDYGYDNQAFLDGLRERGFYVADEARANYLMTGLSLLATRDMEYLDGERLRAQAAADDDWGPVYRGLRSHWGILDTLDPLGYRFAYIGPQWAPAQDHPEADISYGAGEEDEFTAIFIETTLLRALSAFSEEPEVDHRRRQYERVVYQWESLHRSRDIAGPKFVHAHLVLPHQPWVFDAQGNWVTEQEERAMAWEEGYVGQVLYANDKVLELVDSLLDQPIEQRPVILLQADEGPWPLTYLRERERPWAEATSRELSHKFGVLNAIYLPGVDAAEAKLYPSISLVNTFRVIFNSYFDAGLQLLPDRSYTFRDIHHIYDLTDVTDRFSRLEGEPVGSLGRRHVPSRTAGRPGG